MPDEPTYTITLPQPSNEGQLYKRLMAISKFANRLGLTGHRITHLDFSKNSLTIVPEINVTAHCEPTHGSN